MSFLPICNVCLLEIRSGTQGILLSCGHFVCRDCCGAFEPSVCPHCGSRGRAASLDHPPAEVRDYLQNPLTQFRASSDVAMFQLDHFRSVAKQASKALHELRLRYSREVKRREEAEKEVEELRARAARVSDFRGDGREGFSGDRSGSFVAAFGEGRARSERSNNSGVDSNSPIGKLRQRFLGVRSEESGEKMPVPRPPQGERHGRAREDVRENPRQAQAMREAGGAVATALRESGSDGRPSMSFAGPSSSLSQTVGQGIGGKPNTPRTTSGPPSGTPLIERRIVPGEQQPRQQVPAVSQRPETTGRPVRPAWQDTGRVRLGGERGGGGSQQLARPSTPRHGQVFSPQARQQPQPGRPQVRTEMKDLRRPTSGQDAANGRGGRPGQFPAVAAYDNRPSTGAACPTSSPASPLVGVGGSLKRPSSGGLPSPKRPGSSSAADRAGGTRQGRIGTPLPLTPFRTCPPSPRLRSPQLPFTPRSTPRPTSVQRPHSTGGGKGAGRFDGPNGRRAPTPSGNPQGTNLPQSLAAAGLFPPQGPR